MFGGGLLDLPYLTSVGQTQSKNHDRPLGEKAAREAKCADHDEYLRAVDRELKRFGDE